MAEPARWIEAAFLIPLTEDAEVGDGSTHPRRRWGSLEAVIVRRWGGFTQNGAPVRGSWRDPETGSVVSEASHRYTIALPENELPRLRRFLAAAAVVFRQQTIYLSIAGRVEFIQNPRRRR